MPESVIYLIIEIIIPSNVREKIEEKEKKTYCLHTVLPYFKFHLRANCLKLRMYIHTPYSYLMIYLSVFWGALFRWVSTYLFIYLFIYPFIYLGIYLSICLFIFLIPVNYQFSSYKL